MTDESREKVRELAIVALVSGAHFWSHFYVLAIPSVLPLIRGEFGVSNIMLSMVIAGFGLMSALWQFPMGIFSDRYGARAFMIGGLGVLGLAVAGYSLAPAVPVMILIAVVAGIADSVFHPADYTIITAKVRQPWLGRAYAVHTFSGFLGFAAAPTVMTLLLAYDGWRNALAVVGLAGFATAMLLFLFRNLFAGVTYKPTRPPAAEQSDNGHIRFLLAPPLMMMFLFYVAAALSVNGIHNFANSALIETYGVDIVEANTALAVYLWGNTIGVLVGGVMADRLKRFDLTASIGYLVAATFLCLIGLTVLPFHSVLPALFFAGSMIGVIMPARDLAVRAVAPAGGIGKAFGYVSSGFGVGAVIGPLFFGIVMDLNLPQLVFFVSAGMMLVTIGVALAASRVARRTAAVNARAEPQGAE